MNVIARLRQRLSAREPRWCRICHMRPATVGGFFHPKELCRVCDTWQRVATRRVPFLDQPPADKRAPFDWDAEKLFPAVKSLDGSAPTGVKSLNDIGAGSGAATPPPARHQEEELPNVR